MAYEAFISYRRKGSGDLPQYLHDKLMNNYSIPSFLDKDEMRFLNFKKQLITNNLNSRVLILLLSPGALDRCSQHGDWVKTEISLFLAFHKKIIIIKYKDFEFPENLPKSLNKLRRMKYIEYDPSSYNHGKEKVLNDVANILLKNWTDEDRYALRNFLNEERMRGSQHNTGRNLTHSYKLSLKDDSKEKFYNHLIYGSILIVLWVVLGFLQYQYHTWVTATLLTYNVFVLLTKNKYKNLLASIREKSETDSNAPITNWRKLSYRLSRTNEKIPLEIIKNVFFAIGIVFGGLFALTMNYDTWKNIHFLKNLLPDPRWLTNTLIVPLSIITTTISMDILLKLILHIPMVLNASLSKYLTRMHIRHSVINKIIDNKFITKIISLVLALILEFTLFITLK